jgi:uncharacterized membrane protein YGL010W
MSAFRRLLSDSLLYLGVPVGDTSGKVNLEVSMLLALAVVLLILAVVGGIAIHPLLFLIAVLAVLALFAGRSGRF